MTSPLQEPFARLKLALVLLPTLLSVGTVGYAVIEEMSIFDAFYMTLITVSTVGFSEVGQLGQAGRVFTAGLIMAGVFLLAFATGSFIETIVEGELAEFFGRRKMAQKIAELKDHWIICGYGRMGNFVVREMQRAKVPPAVVLLDSNAARVNNARDHGLLAMEADATDEEALALAGIERARGLVSLVASDAENVFICLTARGMNPRLTIIARALEEKTEAKLRRAGADKVVSPYVVGGHRLSQAVLQPAVAEFLEFAAGHDLSLEMEEARVGAGSALEGVALRDSGIRSELDLIVLAIRRSGGEMLFNPGADTVLEDGDTLIALGPGRCIIQLRERASGPGEAAGTP
jgi:voltage-gated potassium channel